MDLVLVWVLVSNQIMGFAHLWAGPTPAWLKSLYLPPPLKPKIQYSLPPPLCSNKQGTLPPLENILCQCMLLIHGRERF